ncbi:bile acid:sodium symporter family protein [Corynebacterium sp. TA-R-1]|uniref:Bile acid:sodium symporter family protein n=1 Tax=Corynebacterium stercoris TaxID=2943490 RepID=A0ABT1FZS7_9CORY|nr:bile acid:sodium symporter family protein [Corynebacterium stercoris]MCP1387280.1 bile acid:sodium symporter family protein [Corynebacterium stercoris]
MNSSPAPAVNHSAERSALIASVAFPILIIIGGLVGYFAPTVVEPVSGWTTWLLGAVMFGMGLTLKVQDFAVIAKKPLPVVIGVIAQFVIMPLIAVLVTWLLRLPPEIAAGVILVGCAPGGTTSNVVTFLSRGDVALSVAMTSVSTLLAPIMTPLLTLWLAGQYLPVSAGSMAVSTVKMVLIPVVLGLTITFFLPKFAQLITPALPWISVVAIAMIVAIIVRGSREQIPQAGLIVLVAVMIHNLLGYALGYLTGKATGQNESTSRTIAVEVGMQNSGLAATLANAYMTPLAALPGVLFSVWHTLSGSLFAMTMRVKDDKARKAAATV